MMVLMDGFDGGYDDGDDCHHFDDFHYFYGGMSSSSVSGVSVARTDDCGKDSGFKLGFYHQ